MARPGSVHRVIHPTSQSRPRHSNTTPRPEAKDESNVQKDNRKIQALKIAAEERPLTPGDNSPQAVKHTPGPADALAAQRPQGMRNFRIANGGGLIQGLTPLGQQPVGEHNILSRALFPAARAPHGIRIIGAECPLRHQGGTIAPLKALNGGNAD